MKEVDFFLSPMISIGVAGISLATIGTVVSIVAGLLGIIYTLLKIYIFIKEKIYKKF